MRAASKLTGGSVTTGALVAERNGSSEYSDRLLKLIRLKGVGSRHSFPSGSVRVQTAHWCPHSLVWKVDSPYTLTFDDVKL